MRCVKISETKELISILPGELSPDFYDGLEDWLARYHGYGWISDELRLCYIFILTQNDDPTVCVWFETYEKDWFEVHIAAKTKNWLSRGFVKILREECLSLGISKVISEIHNPNAQRILRAFGFTITPVFGFIIVGENHGEEKDAET